MASTPAPTATRAPARCDEWAVTRAPRAWAAATAGSDLVDRPRGDVRLRAIEVQLDEVGPVVELAGHGGLELGRVGDLDGPVPLHRPGLEHPRARRPDVRIAGSPTPSIADAQGHGALPAIDRVDPHRRPDVAGPSDAGAGEQPRVRLGDLDETLRRVADPVDPVGTAGQGQVAVGIDHPGHDRRTGGIDHGAVGRHLALVIARPDPVDDPVADEHADTDPEPIRAAIGQRTVAVQGGGHRSTVRHGYPAISEPFR